MDKTLSVIYDGEVFRPEVAPNLEPSTRYDIIIKDVSTLPQTKTVSPQETSEAGAENGWKLLESLIGTIQAPEDWALEHDHYLYGTPKHNEVVKDE